MKDILMKGQDFDFMNDYSSSDYECIDKEEIDHLHQYQTSKNEDFD
jgi:hypothetical protein